MSSSWFEAYGDDCRIIICQGVFVATSRSEMACSLKQISLLFEFYWSVDIAIDHYGLTDNKMISPSSSVGISQLCPTSLSPTTFRGSSSLLPLLRFCPGSRALAFNVMGTVRYGNTHWIFAERGDSDACAVLCYHNVHRGLHRCGMCEVLTL